MTGTCSPLQGSGKIVNRPAMAFDVECSQGFCVFVKVYFCGHTKKACFCVHNNLENILRICSLAY